MIFSNNEKSEMLITEFPKEGTRQQINQRKSSICNFKLSEIHENIDTDGNEINKIIFANIEKVIDNYQLQGVNIGTNLISYRISNKNKQM